ncbi:hypothetical protein GBA52_000313 [Prunus armeniaca]|nr:hypothetical protein GBA52_000313 [Prunus armeniaca]
MEKAEQLLLLCPKMKMKKVECVCGGGRKDFGQSRISTSRPSLLLKQRKQKGRGGGRRAGVCRRINVLFFFLLLLKQT